MCDGPRTDPAGFAGITWPVTSQSNRWRSAARRSLAVGAAALARLLLDPGGDVKRLHGRRSTARRVSSHQAINSATARL